MEDIRKSCDKDTYSIARQCKVFIRLRKIYTAVVQIRSNENWRSFTRSHVCNKNDLC